MDKKLEIQLPKPCHEDWNKMIPAEQGRFCNSCQKAVVDFTGMSDAQLVAFFKKPSTGSICGRFDNVQLGRNLTIPGKRMPWLKYFLQLLVPTFLFACKAKSQGEPRIMGDTVFVEIQKNLKDKEGNIKQDKIESKKTKGKVTDENRIGIPNTSVVIKGSNLGVLTDKNGNYEIDLERLNPKQIIVFSSVGFMTIELSVSSLQQTPNCVLKMTSMLMGEVVVTGPGKRKKGKSSN